MTPLAQWHQRIAWARRVRREWRARYRVEMLGKTFSGLVGRVLSGQIMTDDEELEVNRFYPTLKAVLPGLLSQNPKFFVRPVPQGEQLAEERRSRMLEAVLEQTARQDGHFLEAAKMALQQSFFSLGCLKVIYDPTEERNPRAGEPMYQTNQAGEYVRDATTGLLLPLRDPQSQEAMTEPPSVLTDEVYRWQWVPAQRVLLPDEGPDMQRWTWIGEEVTVPLEEAQQDSRFSETLRRQLRPTGPTEEEQPHVLSDEPAPNQSADPMVTYVECWHRRENKLYIVAEGQPFSQTEFLLEEDYPDGIEDDPYALLRHTLELEPEPKAWPIPPLWAWLSVHQSYQEQMRHVDNAAKRSARKIYYDQNTFPDQDTAQAALQSSADMEAVMVNDTARPPIIAMDPSSTPDVMRTVGILNTEWQLQTGLTGARLAAPEANTATEAALTERSAGLRDTEMRGTVDAWLGRAGTKMAQLLQGTLTLETMVRIRGFHDREFQQFVQTVYGPQVLQQLSWFPGLKQMYRERYAQEVVMPVTRDMLQFEAEVVVTPGSTRPRTLATDRAALMELLKVFAAFPQMLQSRQLMSRIAEMWEWHDDAMLDELNMLGKQAQAAQAAPRGQPTGAGGRAVASGNGAGTPLMQALMGGGGD